MKKNVQYNILLTSPVRRDGAQFDGERVLDLSVMLHRVVVPARAVPELAPTQNGAVGEVEPEVVSLLAALTPPALRRDLLTA